MAGETGIQQPTLAVKRRTACSTPTHACQDDLFSWSTPVFRCGDSGIYSSLLQQPYTPLCLLFLLLLQREPGRWSRYEERLLREMKEIIAEDLRRHPPFPEVVGSRRMLRFLRWEMLTLHDVLNPSPCVRSFSITQLGRGTSLNQVHCTGT